ncbi:paladin isoform X2 [Selaginella moellendorffii]|uniref:paladin isoform X2 n=2 Tax=Selaginella moellendorffii TaxID=88036 RepID=UPI000D1CA7EE|nr:paladin isoform X2 [Selaginella moellendorffii]|eukprot:XP_024527697.1 paladin isoform X2 [Selaginella moellendorffii]
MNLLAGKAVAPGGFCGDPAAPGPRSSQSISIGKRGAVEQGGRICAARGGEAPSTLDSLLGFEMASSELVASREPEHVIMSRGGSVLGRKTILKSDHFPGCQNKRLQPHVQGAPNYRQVSSLPVFGVAIPTIDGIRKVLDLIGANRNGGHKRVLWHNLREEPVIYINGRPFVLREIERPFTNLEYTGINRVRVEEMEARLKEDVLREAGRFGCKILVCDEMPDGQMIDQWEPITDASVLTPLEVYDSLCNESYFVDYERLPITDEKSPKERDFDLLVQRVAEADINTALVFNCQMGRGRTTTGMVIATLVYLKRSGSAGIRRSRSFGEVLGSAEESIDEFPDSEEGFRQGEYTVVRSLCRVLEGGVEGKRQVDTVIDRCSAMQNLREAINTYRNSILRQADEKKRESSLSYFVEYLERYYFLICFAVYIHTDQSALTQPGGFQQWMKARPELYSILRRLLRRDPMGALGYRSKPPVAAENGRPSRMEAVAACRTGDVLGKQTVLKGDHYPGCHNPHLPESVEGAPNFREIPGFPVYGVANPTVSGIKAVLERVGGGKGGRPVLWHNMREEPVVYINGQPFVLREVERPYKNMLEYTGIDRDRVEQMEARLKEDVLKEAERYDGAIMVNHESKDGFIFDSWETVTPEGVQTPFEVYSRLVSEGYSIEYSRMPITDGKAPKSSDFDTLTSKIVSAPKKTVFVFNCQMGRGRTTTGTVIACLVKLRCDYGKPFRLPSALPGSSVDGGSDSSGEENGEAGDEHLTFKPAKLERCKSTSVLVMDDISIVRRLTRLLEDGVACREALDDVIDRCAALQNLRQAILQYRKSFNQQNLESPGRRAALNRGVEYLERYCMMIAFASYLGSEAFSETQRLPFKVWLNKRPEIKQMKWSMRLRPARFFAVPEVEFRALAENCEGDEILEAIVKSRNGSVLGKRAILKMYHFPGQSAASCFDIPGVPHMRKIDGFPVYSMATPTAQGAKAAFACLKTAVDQGKHAVVTDLREEAVVYIRGNPFVLRELDQPVSTLKHVGIKGSAVEQMEYRLKEDILAEMKRSGGRVVLHREECNPLTNKSDVIGYWEVLTSDDVKIPAEVYTGLAAEGYKIDYKRIPLTRERAALAMDVDAIQDRLNGSGSEYVYISHTGYGGVAYAMAITCMGLQAEAEASLAASSSGVPSCVYGPIQRPADDINAFKQGDYRDILSLVRVLPSGPFCKAEVDTIIDRCSEAGNLRDDILYYKQQLECCQQEDEEHRAYIQDMGVKALRRYAFLIAFRSFLTSRTPNSSFAAWMHSRPELGHLCYNLKLE